MRPTLIFIFILICTISNAQTVSTGISPEISFNIKLNNSYSINTKIESFHSIGNNIDSDVFDWKYLHKGTDFQLILNYKLSPFASIAVGYMYGIKSNEQDSHRSIQQISIFQRINNTTFNHRVRLDQTYFFDSAARLRFRYRLSTEIPLAGRTLDPKEFYFLTSEEFLVSYQMRKFGLENRFVLSLGYYFENKNKLQFGIDYRYTFLQDRNDHNIWFKVAYFISI